MIGKILAEQIAELAAELVAADPGQADIQHHRCC